MDFLSLNPAYCQKQIYVCQFSTFIFCSFNKCSLVAMTAHQTNTLAYAVFSLAYFILLTFCTLKCSLYECKTQGQSYCLPHQMKLFLW